MSKSASVSSSRVEQAVLIVFADLTRFMVNSRSTPDATLAEVLVEGVFRRPLCPAGRTECRRPRVRQLKRGYAGARRNSRGSGSGRSAGVEAHEHEAIAASAPAG